MNSTDTFWIMLREKPVPDLLMPNAIGPYETLDEAEKSAHAIAQSGKYHILDGTGKLASIVTIELQSPKINTARTK